MEISKVYQAPEQIVVSAQSGDASQVDEKAGPADAVQKDYQVNLQDGLKMKLAEFANALQNREQLIESLPEDIKKAVVELLKQMSADTDLPQGLTSLLKGQKNMAEQLKNMCTLLELAAVLNKDGQSEVQDFLQKALEKFTEMAKATPEQSAKELLQLAKQLAVSTTVPQGNFKQAVEQLLQALPESMQQLNPDEQKIVAKLAKLLGKDMPAQLQQLAKQIKLPELPGVWATLKAVDAWQFKDIQPKTLQAAADLLGQLAQEMSPEKATVTAQLEQIIKNLPTEAGSKATVITQLEQFIKNLPAEAGSKATVVAQLEQFIKNLPTEAGGKATVVTQLEQFIKNLPAEVGSKGIADAQLEQFVKTLPQEVGNKGTVVGQLEQFLKTLPPEIAKALQKALQQGNIAENLRGLASTFGDAEVLHENMSSAMKSFLGKMDESFATKYSSIPAETNNGLQQLAKQFMDTGKTIEQLKIFINQLKTQLFAADPKLLEKEQDVLDHITKLFEPNIPQVLQGGEVKQKLPELAKIWVLLTALEAEQWKNIESQDLQKSAGVIKELAQSMSKSTALVGEKQAEHSTLSFSIPLQVAEGIYYPAHIHIYHEEKESSSQLTQREFETWLRVCVDTENIGMVDSVFRLYGDNKLDVRVNFPVTSAANQFSQNIPDIRKSLSETKLNLTDIVINKA